MKPLLAVFPKAYMQALCRDGSMSLYEWIELAAPLKVDGLEWYAGFTEMRDEKNWIPLRKAVESHGMKIPMLCCSPDFTHPDPGFRQNEVQKQKIWISMIHALGGSYCRVLSGQRRPGLSIEQGIQFTVECISECLTYAQSLGIKLNIENHYKDDFWLYPEFAQKMDIFCAIVNAIDHLHFGVNYDPSNAYLAGDDPIELLHKISYKVITMHASDRYLISGTLENLRHAESGIQGYVQHLRHGEIGKGLNNYDAIFSELKRAGFQGWISVEDGVDGFDQLERSVQFLKNKINQHWQ